MTTTTHPAIAPTADEIRAAIRGRMRFESSGTTVPVGDEPELRAALRGAVTDYADPITWPAFVALNVRDAIGENGAADSGVWANLRRTEAHDLERLAEDAIERATERCEAIIFDELTAAALAFGELHPEAPRGTPKADA